MLITQSNKEQFSDEDQLLKTLTQAVEDPKNFYQQEDEDLLNKSCDLDIMPVTQKCYRILKDNFGRENRIIRNYLKILLKIGLNEKANEFINQELFKNNLNDQEARKMQIASTKYKVSIKQYTETLIEYINNNYEDIDGWLELAQIYEENQQALYCYEEIILINPKLIWIYQKMSEMHFSIGNLNNFQAARKYLCFLLTLNKNCLRSLWSLKQVCQQLKKKEPSNKQNDAILKVCNQRLKELYKNNEMINIKQINQILIIFMY